MIDVKALNLITSRKVTAGGVTGAAWVDAANYDLEHGCTAVLSVGQGATPGTCGGYIQASDSSTGAGAATIGTFPTQTSAGGLAQLAITTNKRYVKFVGTAQAAKSMYEAVMLIARAHFLP